PASGLAEGARRLAPAKRGFRRPQRHRQPDRAPPARRWRNSAARRRFAAARARSRAQPLFQSGPARGAAAAPARAAALILNHFPPTDSKWLTVRTYIRPSAMAGVLRLS